jgi:hypothetical protein
MLFKLPLGLEFDYAAFKLNVVVVGNFTGSYDNDPMVGFMDDTSLAWIGQVQQSFARLYACSFLGFFLFQSGATMAFGSALVSKFSRVPIGKARRLTFCPGSRQRQRR